MVCYSTKHRIVQGRRTKIIIFIRFGSLFIIRNAERRWLNKRKRKKNAKTMSCNNSLNDNMCTSYTYMVHYLQHTHYTHMKKFKLQCTIVRRPLSMHTHFVRACDSLFTNELNLREQINGNVKFAVINKRFPWECLSVYSIWVEWYMW